MNPARLCHERKIDKSGQVRSQRLTATNSDGSEKKTDQGKNRRFLRGFLTENPTGGENGDWGNSGPDSREGT
jgi:hypothetical protein